MHAVQMILKHYIEPSFILPPSLTHFFTWLKEELPAQIIPGAFVEAQPSAPLQPSYEADTDEVPAPKHQCREPSPSLASYFKPKLTATKLSVLRMRIGDNDFIKRCCKAFIRSRKQGYQPQ